MGLLELGVRMRTRAKEVDLNLLVTMVVIVLLAVVEIMMQCQRLEAGLLAVGCCRVHISKAIGYVLLARCVEAPVQRRGRG